MPGPLRIPSTVMIFWPRPSRPRPARDAHPLTALPSTNTVHAPHWAQSQPGVVRARHVEPEDRRLPHRLSRTSTVTDRATPSMFRSTRRMFSGNAAAWAGGDAGVAAGSVHRPPGPLELLPALARPPRRQRGGHQRRSAASARPRARGDPIPRCNRSDCDARHPRPH